MKKLLIAALMASGILAKAQEAETPKFFNAADPTQLYTKIDFNVGINFTTGYGAIEPDHWIINLGGDFAIKKFNFGFNIPFSNLGNFYSGLEDIDLHVGYQPFNGDRFFKSSLITAGVKLPSHDGYSTMDGWLQANRLFYIDYTASLKINDKISLFPKIGFERGSNVDESVPRFNITSYKAGLGANYQFNAKNFLQFNLSYEHSTRCFVNQNYTFNNNESTLDGNSLMLSLKYQYAITPNAQVYSKINVDFGERFKYRNGTNSFVAPGFFLGLQYFIK